MAAAASPASASPAPAQDTVAGKEPAMEERWRPVMMLPCRLTVDLALPNFKVADFLALRNGSVVATGWAVSRDVPLRINGILIGWAGLEGAGNRMAVRVTELA